MIIDMYMVASSTSEGHVTQLMTRSISESPLIPCMYMSVNAVSGVDELGGEQ